MPLNTDSCVFIARRGKSVIILAIYVDDGLLTAETSDVLDQMIAHLKSEFEITVVEPKIFIGLEIMRDRQKKTIRVSQRA